MEKKGLRLIECVSTLLFLLLNFVFYYEIESFQKFPTYSKGKCWQPVNHVRRDGPSGNSKIQYRATIDHSNASDEDSNLVHTFEEFIDIPKWLIESCKNLGFERATDTQYYAIPTIMEGKDVIIQAQTGSGKTLAYSLPILSKIDASRAAIQAVIVVPTRELGLQVSSVLKQLANAAPKKIQVMSVIEGSNNRRQLIWATAEPPHIVVGNPKSLQRLVDMGRLRLNSVNFVVIDEVDACMMRVETKLELHRLLSRHLSNSFQEIETLDEVNQDIKENRVFRDLTRDDRSVESYRSNRQTIMCSATIPQRKYFAQACYRNGWTERLPELINISKDKLLPPNIKHEYIPCGIDQRIAITSYILRAESKLAVGTSEPMQSIVFVDKEAYIEQYKNYILGSFRKNLFDMDIGEESIRILTSDVNIEARKSSLDSFRDGTTKILLCSDLAARGIDIPATALVVQVILRCFFFIYFFVT